MATRSLSPAEGYAKGRLATIANQAFQMISRRFPVCAASDEFYFFPQILNASRDWSGWDDFSADSVDAAADELRSAENELTGLRSADLAIAEQIDIDLLQSALRTLREQLQEVAPHRTQPTFHLTVVAAGLAEALVSPDPAAWSGRIGGLPKFLQRAAACLDTVPQIFLQLGRSMIADLRDWTDQLQRGGRETGPLQQAFAGFSKALENITVAESYLMPEELVSRLVSEHIGCGTTIDQVAAVLDQEFEEMREVLEREADRLACGRRWTEAETMVPFVEAPGGDLLALYLSELKKMEEHCRCHDLVPELLSTDDTLQVAAVPAAMAAVRASDAYSAIPGHPPQGGTFFVMQEGYGRHGRIGRSLEFRMTAAHEAWPGHHLLDVSRWGLTHEIRRPLEQPLFYEGWACLAEELMARTGYLAGPWDRFLLARRRIERAARGLIDLGLQTGRMNLRQASDQLAAAGYRTEHARTIIPKYLLRPGYQVCYTFGLKQGLQSLEDHGQGSIGLFARKVLAQGEIGFDRLIKVFVASDSRAEQDGSF